jgi:apolipoprotein N-acyltransferase
MISSSMKAFAKDWGPALATGTGLALTFPRWGCFPLAWFALIPLIARCRSLTPAQAALHFYAAGLLFHLLALQWLTSNIYWAGGWATIGYVLLCMYLATYWAALGAAWVWIKERPGPAGGPITFALLWVAMEFAQARLFTGFGWLTLGYAHARDLLLLQWASVGTVHLVSAIVVCGGACLAYAFVDRKARGRYMAAALCLAALSHGGGWMMLDDPETAPSPLVVGIFQSNFPVEMKQDRSFHVEMVRRAVSASQVLAETKDTDLIVWPEALVVNGLERFPVQDMLTAFVRDADTDLFTGSDRVDRDSGEFYNSSYLINREGEMMGHYDKMHLAPFGEYFPFGDLLPFVSALVPGVGGMATGDEVVVFETGGRRFGPLICFEVLFPAMAEELRNRGGDFLVVITNLGWFGQSNAIPQELEIARMRAVETRLPLIHTANTGISGLVDPWGRFTAVDGLVDEEGRYREFVNTPHPEETIRMRLTGAFPIPEPGHRPLPINPGRFPWIAVGALLAVVGASLIWPASTVAAGGRG